MQSIDQHRHLEGFLLMAATNYVHGLEPTLIREGRFDAKLRMGLPGEDGRKEILGAQLAMLAWRKHDLSNIARRTPGWSPARLSSLVDRATLLANGNPIEECHLVEALESAGGQLEPRDFQSIDNKGDLQANPVEVAWILPTTKSSTSTFDRREGALRNVREFKQIHRMYFGRAPA